MSLPHLVPTSWPEAVLQVQPAGRSETHQQLRRGHSSQAGGVGCEAQGCLCPSCSAQSESGVLLWDKSVLTLSSSAREQRSCPGRKAGSVLCQETNFTCNTVGRTPRLWTLSKNNGDLCGEQFEKLVGPGHKGKRQGTRS